MRHLTPWRAGGALLAAVALLAIAWVLFTGPSAVDLVASSKYPVTRQALDTAREALAHLPVREDRPGGGSAGEPYEREEFGEPWQDVDRNGCDTRNDVLARDLRDAVTATGTGACIVESGTLADPYTGQVMHFDRTRAPQAVQIDHVVALADAWQAGADGWTPAQRVQFANDPRNLLAVSGQANQDKGGADASAWMPAQRSYHCAYAVRQLVVKGVYGLSVTAAERDTLAATLELCVIVADD